MTDYAFEIYTKNPDTLENGWNIKHVVIKAETKEQAKNLIKTYPLFDCIITINDWFCVGKRRWPIWDGKKINGYFK